MHSKNLQMCLTAAALGLLTLALMPTMATAVNEPEVTYPTGTRLATGSKVRAYSAGEVKLTSSAGTFSCTFGQLTGTLRKNNGSEVEMDIESSGFLGTGGGDRCAGPFGETEVKGPSASGPSWCVRSTPAMKEGEVQVRGGNCASAAQAIRLAVTIPQCIYEREAASFISGTFTTQPSGAVITSKVEYNKMSGPIICPTKWYLDSSYALEKDEESAGSLHISGGPRLTYPIGTTLPVGSKIRGRNVGSLSWTNAAGEKLLECPSSELRGTLTKNNGSEIEADIESTTLSGTGAGGACTGGVLGNMAWTSNSALQLLPWCLQATSKLAEDAFQIRGGGCGKAAGPIRMGYDPVSECIYERGSGSPISAAYKAHPEKAEITLSEAEFTKVGGQAACPGSIKLDSSFQFERDNVPPSAPLYIS